MDTEHMFSRKDLWKLLIPIIIENLLNSLMGTVDTIMVSNVGGEAISAVALVDSINLLVVMAFSALAAGGTIICAQYIGSKNEREANRAAKQLVFIMFSLALFLMVCFLAFRRPLLHVTFGQVEDSVMEASLIYFLYTVLSYPFLGLFNAGASIYRAQGNSRTPMTISIISNITNVAGNAILIWGFNMGVAGAAISTLVSRILAAVIVMYLLRNKNKHIYVRNYLAIRPEFKVIKKILVIGIPSGIENGMFQFGKLVIQSTVSKMGTDAIAAQAMTVILENFNGIASIGVGIGMMTVVGECMGANRKDEAIYYIKKLTKYSEFLIIGTCIIALICTKPITMIAGMSDTSADMCLSMMIIITIVKPLVWVPSFTPVNGMRAAGDVKFSMIVSCITMWLCRVSLCIFLATVYDMGPMAVWWGMFADWTIRGILYAIRFHSRKWMKHVLI